MSLLPFQMAACNFRRGLILFNLQRQMAMSQKNATFSTSTVILGGGHAPSKYELHGGEKQKLPIGKKYFILCFRGLSFLYFRPYTRNCTKRYRTTCFKFVRLLQPFNSVVSLNNLSSKSISFSNSRPVIPYCIIKCTIRVLETGGACIPVFFLYLERYL